MDMSSPIPDCKFPKDRNQALLYIFLCPQNLVFVLYLLNGKWCIESKLKVDRVHIVIETDRSPVVVLCIVVTVTELTTSNFVSTDVCVHA